MSTTERLRRPPGWGSRPPLLRAWRLEVVNRVRRWGGFQRPIFLSAAAGVMLVAAVALFVLLSTRLARWLLPLAATHLLTVAILMGLQGSVLAHRGRQKWTRFYCEGWLSTLPVSRRAQSGAVALRVCCVPIAVLAMVIATVMIGEMVQEAAGLSLPIAWSMVWSHVSPIIMACVSGTLVGMPVGWWLPQRSAEVPPPPSSQVRGASRRAVALSGISRWPLTQTKVWLQPRSIARLMIVCVALPMDVPANIAVTLLWMLIVGTYLLALLRATVHVAREGAKWLRPTPLGFGRFAWAVLQFPLLKQLQWTAMAAVMLVAMKANPATVLRVAELWLAVFSAVSSVALANAWQSRGMRLKMVLSVGLLAALESLRHHFALPCALLFSGWQLRKTVRL